MLFLSYKECADWCSQHRYPIEERYSQRPEPALQPPLFHLMDFTPPVDSGRKIWFAGFLYSLIDPSPEILIHLAEWDVWSSSQDMNLFMRFRQACGEKRPLHETPGHLLSPGEKDDAISIICASLLFVWNCHVLSASGRDAFFISHDGFGYFASCDESTTRSADQKIKDALK